MKKRYFYIILYLSCFLSISSYSQINCTVPDPPVLRSVSVQPETGNTVINWTPSPSSDIAGYIIYSYTNDNGNRGDSIGTVLGAETTRFIYVSTITKYNSVSYVVSAYRSSSVIPGKFGCASPFSNVLNTIFAAASVDTCSKKITVSWNSYSSSPTKVTGYSILMSVDRVNYTEAGTVSSDAKNFILSNFATDSEYFFFVKANLEDGSSASSNRTTSVSTKMQRPPQWINFDYATLNAENKVSLSATIDPSSEINLFRLERKSGPADTFHELAQLKSVNAAILYTDNQADVKLVNYYRLSAINNCPIPAMISNLASNIVLSLKTTGNDINLSWNSYKNWVGKVSSYRLFINTGKGFEEQAVIQPSDTVFTLGYHDIMYDITGNEVCFFIKASEATNPHVVTGISNSSIACTGSTEIITVPNVFTPNSGTANAFFKPVLSFTPLDYHLIISSRQGIILFETRNYFESWDGSHNGNPQQQDVYLWFLKVITPSGKSISRTGTVTIFNSR